MSGGHFNFGTWQLIDIADQIENIVSGDAEISVSSDIAKRLFVAEKQIRTAEEMIKAVDYLLSGDHSDESFIKIFDNIEGNKMSAILQTSNSGQRS